jgi:hypothetical protein
MESRFGQAYNEEAFWYFLAIERKRSERSHHPFLLVLVDLKELPGADVRIDQTVAPKLFSGLWLCLRETDFIGWYRQERVAGAVVAEVQRGLQGEVSRVLGQRVSGILGARLPSEVAHRVQVRVYQYPAPPRIDSGGSQVVELILGEI